MRDYRSQTAVIESLENRQLFADTLGLTTVSPINVYDRIGFTENVVGRLTYTHNGKPGTDPTPLKAQVKFGDGGTWVSADLVQVGTSGTYLVKASHMYLYQAGGSNAFNVETKITDGGVVADQNTCTVHVMQLTETAARGGMPTPLHSWTFTKPADVKLTVFNNSNAISTYAGVGFLLNQVASFSATTNGQPDTTVGHFYAQINFGDSQAWETAFIVKKAGQASTYAVKNPFHVYKTTGTHVITMVLYGPDGTSVSQQVATVHINAMPMAASEGTKPAPDHMKEALQDVSMAITTSGTLSAKAGQALKNVTVASLIAKIGATTVTDVGGYEVAINWGDTSDWYFGQVVAGPNGTMSLVGSHTYAKAGSYPLVVNVIAPDGTTITQGAVTVNVK